MLIGVIGRRARLAIVDGLVPCTGDGDGKDGMRRLFSSNDQPFRKNLFFA